MDSLLQFNVVRERKIDTSSLQSTKRIGQLGRTVTRQPRIKQTSNVVEHGVEPPDNSESEAEKDFLENRNGDSDHSNSFEPRKETAPTMVGAALKSNGFAVVKRKPKKAATGQTWRERIQGTYAFIEDESSFSDESESSSESQGYSEWGGLSDDGRQENEGQGEVGGHILSDSPNEETTSGDDDDDEGEEAENKAPESKSNVHERAKQFTDWAREQSGFGGTAPNLSTLPQIPNELRKPVEHVPSKSSPPSDIAKTKVLYHSLLLTNRRPSMSV